MVGDEQTTGEVRGDLKEKVTFEQTLMEVRSKPKWLNGCRYKFEKPQHVNGI